MGEAIVNYINNTPLTITLSGVTIKDFLDVKALLDIKNDFNLTGGIIVLQLLHEIQRFVPLVLVSNFYMGPVIITSFSLSGDTTTSFDIYLQPVDLISYFEDLDFDGQAKATTTKYT